MIILNPHIKGRYIDFNHDLKIHNYQYEKVATTPWGLHVQKSLRLIIDNHYHGIKSFRKM